MPRPAQSSTAQGLRIGPVWGDPLAGSRERKSPSTFRCSLKESFSPLYPLSSIHNSPPLSSSGPAATLSILLLTDSLSLLDVSQTAQSGFSSTPSNICCPSPFLPKRTSALSSACAPALFPVSSLPLTSVIDWIHQDSEGLLLYCWNFLITVFFLNATRLLLKCCNYELTDCWMTVT